MRIRSKLLVFCSILLSGCGLMSQEQHRQTLNAIKKLETNVQHNGSAITRGLTAQQTQITAVKQQLNVMSKSMEHIEKENIRPAPLPLQEPTIVYVEKELPAPQEIGKTILGELEWLWFDAINTNFRARIDTGATTSSLNASDIQEYERDGKTWVRFKLAHLKAAPDNITSASAVTASENIDATSESTLLESTIEAPVKRWVKIRQVSSESLERRPVVELQIRLGELHEKTQFTLADRSHMEFPVLLGREFFKDIAVVDVAKSYIHPKFISDKK